jgi:hypothetical protein
MVVAKKHSFWGIGKKYLIRCVTHYHVGELVSIDDKELVLANASWIADTGRFHAALKEGSLGEVEPFVGPVCINRLAIVDATPWDHDLPKEQK